MEADGLALPPEDRNPGPGGGSFTLRYFLDTEFNGFCGPIISLGLVREDGASLYLVYGLAGAPDPWVESHVLPRLHSTPAGIEAQRVDQKGGAEAIDAFLGGDRDPHVIADWPDDVRLFCGALMLGPGLTVALDRLTFEVLRVEPYPTDLEGAVEHNALWDAMALRRRLMRHELPDGDGPLPPAARAASTA